MYNIEEVTIEKGVLPNYKRRMLIEIDSQIYLPMSFITTEYEDIICYDYGGYKPIADIIQDLGLGEIFKYIDELFRVFVLSEAYLLPMEEIMLTVDNIYVEAEKRHLKIKYVPKNSQEVNLLQKGMNKDRHQYGIFMEELMTLKIPDIAKNYIIGIINLIEDNRLIQEILSHISNIQREIHLSGIENISYNLSYR